MRSKICISAAWFRVHYMSREKYLRDNLDVIEEEKTVHFEWKDHVHEL